MLSRFLTSQQNLRLQDFEHFAAAEVAPFSDDWDLQEATPRAVVRALARRGWLGGLAGQENGGLGFDATTFGLLNMAIGTGSASLTGLLNVHSMVLKTIEDWGSVEQKQRWLPGLVSGEIIGAFAQTEVTAGGDSKNLSTRFEVQHDELRIHGQKTWITYGQLADLFLVFGKLQGSDTAALVPRDSPGLTVTPKKNMLGFKGAGLAVLDFVDCRVPSTSIVAKPGFGQSLVSAAALDYGRISVAWTAVGVQQAAVNASARRALARSTFGTLLADQGLIRGYLAEMSGNLLASQLVCLSATRAKEAREDDAIEQILQAKLMASQRASEAADKAMQIHGGHGCDEAHGVSRLYRDAKILQIVEGSNELQKMLIGRAVCDRYSR
jgi:alkylation response protein AidB-like acyl-CoA dehydrogenase